MTGRYSHIDLGHCVSSLFKETGLQPDIAATVADVLIEADLMGYDTHGLQFLPAYLAAIEKGQTRKTGKPEILSDEGSAPVLDGLFLPGQRVVRRALETGLDRLQQYPKVSLAISRSQNISCLATYVKRAADQGVMAILAASAPKTSVVAPHGGRAPRLSINLLAIGIPIDSSPISIDTSSSSITNRYVERTRRANERSLEPWWLDATGTASDDPKVLYADPPGVILPAGGQVQGHKGFALLILNEALTSGLVGAGRSTPEKAGANHVFLLLLDPGAFGGAAAFMRETGFLADYCWDANPVDPAEPVRMPRDRAVAEMARQVKEGINLHPEVLQWLEPCLSKYGLALPEPAS